jgi:hypothetical protein
MFEYFEEFIPQASAAAVQQLLFIGITQQITTGQKGSSRSLLQRMKKLFTSATNTGDG